MTHRSTSTFRARYAETDQMGVVHHASYLVWCEVGRTDYIRDLGTTYSEIERQGVYLAVAAVEVRYGAPAHYDDLIRVESRVESIKSRTITFAYDITRDDPDPAPIARASTTLICLDEKGRTRRLPAEIIELFGGS